MTKPENDRPGPELPPVRPPTLPPDFPDIPQNPYSELQPPPPPGATPDKVEGTTPAATEPEAASGAGGALEVSRKAQGKCPSVWK